MRLGAATAGRECRPGHLGVSLSATPAASSFDRSEETTYTLYCLDFWLHSPSGLALDLDLILFNVGMHDGPMMNNTWPGRERSALLQQRGLPACAPPPPCPPTQRTRPRPTTPPS